MDVSRDLKPDKDNIGQILLLSAISWRSIILWWCVTLVGILKLLSLWCPGSAWASKLWGSASG
jgi:hypothetical protein